MRSLIIVSVVLVAACSAPETRTPATATAAPVRKQLQPPTAEQARQIVADSPDFGEYQFTNAAVALPMKKSAMNEPARDMAAALARDGWITIDGDAVVLNAKAKDDKRFLVRPNGFVDVVPLAKKEMGQVGAVRVVPDGTAVDFSWRWMPNEIGSAFRKGPVHDRFAGEQQATATLISDGKSWSVLRIEPAAQSSRP